MRPPSPLVIGRPARVMAAADGEGVVERTREFAHASMAMNRKVSRDVAELCEVVKTHFAERFRAAC